MTARPNGLRSIAWLVLGTCVLCAAARAAEAPVSAETLGAVRATIDFCSSTDAERAEQYRARAGLFLNGASEDQLAELQKSPDFKSSYAATSAALQQMAREEATDTCKKLLQETH